MSAVKPKYTAIVMAAGSGVRMKTETRKQFLNLLGMPVVAYSLRAFQQNDNISSIVLVVPKGFVDEAMAMCIRYGFNKVRNIAEGSDKRFKSVYRGLQAAPPDTDYVLIHDGVRPMLTGELIDRCCKFVLMTRACVAAVPVTDTIKRANIHGLRLKRWTGLRSGVFRRPRLFLTRSFWRHTGPYRKQLRNTARMKARSRMMR